MGAITFRRSLPLRKKPLIANQSCPSGSFLIEVRKPQVALNRSAEIIGTALTGIRYG